jgi:hypothetical protein
MELSLMPTASDLQKLTTAWNFEKISYDAILRQELCGVQVTRLFHPTLPQTYFLELAKNGLSIYLAKPTMD